MFRAHVQLRITYTPAGLEALFKLSVVTILTHLCRSLQHFCGLWVLSPTRHLVRHVLYLVAMFLLVVGSVAIHLVHSKYKSVSFSED